jgi:class 3 adenylate cyclase
MAATRRLAAILAADVAGYWRRIGADDTLERRKGLRRELLDPKIAEHNGGIVKTSSDGVPVVHAVRCVLKGSVAGPAGGCGSPGGAGMPLEAEDGATEPCQ